MKDSFGNTLNKTIATGAIALVTLLLFVTTAVANTRLGLAAFLPSIILVTSASSIASVWYFGRPRKPDSPALQQLQQLQTKVEELEKRLANAEIVHNFEDRLAHKEAHFRNSNKFTEKPTTMGSAETTPSSNAMPSA